MTAPIFNYDEISDTPYVAFSLGEKATGIELIKRSHLIAHKQSRAQSCWADLF